MQTNKKHRSYNKYLLSNLSATTWLPITLSGGVVEGFLFVSVLNMASLRTVQYDSNYLRIAALKYLRLNSHLIAQEMNLSA